MYAQVSYKDEKNLEEIVKCRPSTIVGL